MLDQILELPAQLVFLGTGDAGYEQQLQSLADAHPGCMAVVLAYNESMAHRIEAAADIFLMPSLFEPCGLNQLYSLRYGTLPLVRAVGGLADTVVDATPASVADASATGFVFREPTANDFLAALQRACQQWQNKETWRELQLTAMAQDFSWQQSAERYLALYRTAPNQGGSDKSCPVQHFHLKYSLAFPQELSRLQEMANDLVYSWDRSIRSLFHRLDRDLWEACGHNPKAFLRRVSQHRLDEAIVDRSYMEDYRRVLLPMIPTGSTVAGLSWRSCLIRKMT